MKKIEIFRVNSWQGSKQTQKQDNLNANTIPLTPSSLGQNTIFVPLGPVSMDFQDIIEKMVKKEVEEQLAKMFPPIVLLKQREEIENKISAIDKEALITYEFERLQENDVLL